MTLVKKLPFKYDIKKLQDTLYYILDKYPTTSYQRISHRHGADISPGSAVSDRAHYPADAFWNVRDKDKNINLIQGTYFGKIYCDIDSLYNINTVYLLKVEGNSTITRHTDSTEVVLLPIVADENYKLIVDNKQILLPADGSIYLLNALLPHIVNNEGKNPSYRLSFTILNYKPKAIYEKCTNYA